MSRITRDYTKLRCMICNDDLGVSVHLDSTNDWLYTRIRHSWQSPLRTIAIWVWVCHGKSVDVREASSSRAPSLHSLRTSNAPLYCCLLSHLRLVNVMKNDLHGQRDIRQRPTPVWSATNPHSDSQATQVLAREHGTNFAPPPHTSSRRVTKADSRDLRLIPIFHFQHPNPWTSPDIFTIFHRSSHAPPPLSRHSRRSRS
jgi:hypothetical protein